MSALPRTAATIPPAIAAGGFPAEIRARADRLRDGTALGSFLADELARLADTARFLGAGSPAELVARREVEEDNLRTHWYDLGRQHEREDAHQLRTFGPGAPPIPIDSRPIPAGLVIPD